MRSTPDSDCGALTSLSYLFQRNNFLEIALISYDSPLINKFKYSLNALCLPTVYRELTIFPDFGKTHGTTGGGDPAAREPCAVVRAWRGREKRRANR